MKMNYNPSNNFSKLKLLNSSNFRTAYIVLQLFLYVSFMSLDILNSEGYKLSNILKFSSIILCFLYVCLTGKVRSNKRDTNILLLAMFFTVISDWFILIKDSYNLGLITFILVQSMYLVRIHLYNNLKSILIAFIRNLLISIFVILIVIKVDIEPEVILILSLAIVYLVTFIFNILDTTILYIKIRRKDVFLFLLGLILFILCDINVGLFNLTNYIQMNPFIYDKIYPFVFLGMWFFYLPSQVILSVSELTEGK